MLMYAIGMLPVLSNLQNWYRNWYADDDSCLLHLCLLQETGLKFGYLPKPKLIVKDELLSEAARISVEDLG